MKPVAPPPVQDTVSTLAAYNQGRDPERLALKYAKMRQSPFIFLRGACHLFYNAIPQVEALTRAPLAWACGDLHFENFGSYKGDNRLVYFDINDFDEAALAPCTWDLLRLLTSLQCGAADLKASAAQAQALSQACVSAYQQALQRGKALWVEGETASGVVAELFERLKDRRRVDFLNQRTVLHKNGRRQLKVDGQKALPVTDDERQRVSAFVQRYAAQQPKPGFYEVLDVARRIAGTGSLGLPRYAVLVEGKGSPDANVLLDLKMAQPSSLIPALNALGVKQPDWADEAQRIVGVQRRMQAVDHAFLAPVEFEGRPWVLKGLQPSEDRVDMAQGKANPEGLLATAQTLGRVLAWDQLRASGRSGSAAADALIAFAQQPHWPEAVLEAALQMVSVTQAQWQAFSASSLGR
ncbi:DUF2252 domain-containing protein [Curvibacter gracilis]|uniref:DUF2252 domain-containing protein n=1 Tax=Curvibacter gracilis TaxID=230310 RepID=UPI000684B13A|nr:DUF2252 family protein [Curvibacter gracilis]